MQHPSYQQQPPPMPPQASMPPQQRYPVPPTPQPQPPTWQQQQQPLYNQPPPILHPAANQPPTSLQQPLQQPPQPPLPPMQQQQQQQQPLYNQPPRILHPAANQPTTSLQQPLQQPPQPPLPLMQQQQQQPLYNQPPRILHPVANQPPTSLQQPLHQSPQPPLPHMQQQQQQQQQPDTGLPLPYGGHATYSHQVKAPALMSSHNSEISLHRMDISNRPSPVPLAAMEALEGGGPSTMPPQPQQQQQQQPNQHYHPGLPNGSNGATNASIVPNNFPTQLPQQPLQQQLQQQTPSVWPPPARPQSAIRPPQPPAAFGPPRPPQPPITTSASSIMRPPMPPYQPVPPPPNANFQQQQQQQLQPPMLRPPAPPQPPGQPSYSGGIPPTARLDGSLRSSQDGTGQRHINLLQDRQLLSPTEGIEVLKPSVKHYPSDANCDPEVMCCTLNVVPSTSSLLQKARLPLGLLLHPFKDLRNLPVIQASVIVRCRSCRTYINPFVQLIDQRRWRCNVCFRTNDLPDEFQYDPVSKVYGEPSRRPEVRSATVEFIAPQEYTVRPPPPATYVMLFDVSLGAAYLSTVCQVLLRSLDRLPGDSRTQLAIMTFNSFLHLYQLDGPRPRMLVLPDLDEASPPLHDGLLVTVSECRDAIVELLETLPLQEFPEAPGSCLGMALQMAYKLAQSYGGRITAFVASLPNLGPGALQNRDDPSARAGKPGAGILQPGTDFYKRLALDCCGVQLGIDLFCLAPQPVDLPSLLPASLFSSGDFFHYPDMSERPDEERARLSTDFNRYITRKIGFEAVMRLRCTKGLSISAFHGSCFVRSTDLLSLPTVNPDAGFGIQLTLEDSLTDVQLAVCQAALLYTSAKGERRIRVHTLAVPVTSRLEDVFRGADQRAIAGLLALMATDRTINSSLTDAREALINAVADLLTAYGNCTLTSGQRIGSLCVPYHLRMLPALVLSLMKCPAFRLGVSTRLDERAGALAAMKLTPLRFLLLRAYPDLYALHPTAWPAPDPQQQQQQQQQQQVDQEKKNPSVSDEEIDEPPRLHLSAQFLERGGLYLLDAGRELLLFVFSGLPQYVYQQLLGVDSLQQVRDGQLGLPELDNPLSERVRGFVECLQSDRPFGAPLTILREDGRMRARFTRYLVEDRSEGGSAGPSYQEFLQTLQKMVKYS